MHLERIAQIQDEVNAKQDQLDKAKEGDADYYTYLKELNGLKKELVDEGTNYEIASAERVKEKKQELEQAAFDFATETAGQLFDIGRTLNESNIAALEADKQKELDLAGNNSTARRRIEENFQKDIIKLRRKQAIYDKLQALFDIGVNTAIAITKATAASPLTFGQPWVTYAIIQGAVQAAAVIAKPLPKYWKGRGKGKQEFALVNEQGPEALVKDGSVRFANRGKKGVTWLQAGEEVKTATETRQMLENAVNTEDGLAYMHSLLKGESVMRQAQEKQDNRMIRAMAKQVLTKEALTGAFSDAVAKLPVSVWEVDDKGARRYTRTLSGKTEIMNSRNQLGSNG